MVSLASRMDEPFILTPPPIANFVASVLDFTKPASSIICANAIPSLKDLELRKNVGVDSDIVFWFCAIRATSSAVARP